MVSVKELLAEYGIDVVHEGNVLRAFCPFHQDTGRPNFTLFPENNQWHCFAGCGGGDVVSLLAKLENIRYADAKERLEGAPVDLDELQEKIDGAGLDDEIYVNVDMNILVSKMAKKYLYEHPENIEQIMSVLQNFDHVNSAPVTYNLMRDILAKVKSFLHINTEKGEPQKVETPAKVEYEISKTYTQAIVKNYQTWKFSTTLTKTVQVENGAQLSAECDKLFTAATLLTEADIRKKMPEIEQAKR